MDRKELKTLERKYWIALVLVAILGAAIIAALILALVIYQAYLRKEKKPSVPDNQRVQERGAVPVLSCGAIHLGD